MRSEESDILATMTVISIIDTKPTKWILVEADNGDISITAVYGKGKNTREYLVHTQRGYVRYYKTLRAAIQSISDATGPIANPEIVLVPAKREAYKPKPKETNSHIRQDVQALQEEIAL